jgi:hypothetical protein
MHLFQSTIKEDAKHHTSRCCRGVALIWSSPPSMTVRVDKAARVHEADIFRLVTGRPASGDSLGDEAVYFFAAFAAQ